MMPRITQSELRYESYSYFIEVVQCKNGKHKVPLVRVQATINGMADHPADNDGMATILPTTMAKHPSEASYFAIKGAMEK